MSEVDVRRDNIDAIKNIRFADLKDDWLTATSLRKSDHGVLIKTDANSSTMILHSKTDVANMIKALNKAIELGWFDNLK